MAGCEGTDVGGLPRATLPAIPGDRREMGPMTAMSTRQDGVVEMWVVADQLGLLRQLGLLPDGL